MLYTLSAKMMGLTYINKSKSLKSKGATNVVLHGWQRHGSGLSPEFLTFWSEHHFTDPNSCSFHIPYTSLNSSSFLSLLCFILTLRCQAIHAVGVDGIGGVGGVSNGTTHDILEHAALPGSAGL